MIVCVIKLVIFMENWYFSEYDSEKWDVSGELLFYLLDRIDLNILYIFVHYVYEIYIPINCERSIITPRL